MNYDLNIPAEFIQNHLSLVFDNGTIITNVGNYDDIFSYDYDKACYSYDLDAYYRVISDIPYRAKKYGYTYKQAVYCLLNQSQIKQLKFLYKIYRNL